jgi:hypothetical protein
VWDFDGAFCVIMCDVQSLKVCRFSRSHYLRPCLFISSHLVSQLNKWLRSHPQVACFQGETHDLKFNKVGTFVKKLYQKLPEGPYKRCYKAPEDVTRVRD